MNRTSILLLFQLLLVFPLKSQVFINEFQVSNINTRLDPGVNYGQWIEIYNGGDHNIDLYGYYLSDEPGELQKFKIPEHIYVSSKRSVILWLDAENEDYINIKLDMDGGELTISDPSGEMMDYATYGQQYIDISYGRKVDGSSDWYFFKDPTPGDPNNTIGYQFAISHDTLVFSLPGGFYSGVQHVALTINNDSGVIRYTKNGSWPNELSPQYHTPIEILSSSVIRARVYYDDKLPGKVYTNSYFLNEESSLPVVSISTDPANFFSGDRGIYVEGNRGIAGWCSPVPVNWNRDWERPINFEYYTAGGEQVINQLAGTKITGGCSRFNSFKSLALYARKSYGDDSFSYPFFSSKKISDFKGLVLRNSGNDGYYSMLRNGFMQSLVMGKMDIDYLGYQPANVFINGEYWGILNVREKINEHYLASNYSIDPDQIDMLEKEDYFDYNMVISGSGEHYEELINFIEQNDLSLESNFDYVSMMMDVEEFLNYYLVDIYFQNEDWPQNNIKYWRYHGEGGKWRWILFDTDFGWGLFPGSGNSLNWATRGASDDKLIRALLENDSFKSEFIQRMAGFMNTVFQPDRVNFILDSIADMIGREMPRHTQRWGKPSAIEFDYQTNNKMPRFAETRPDSMRLFMRYKFGIPGLNTLSTSADDPQKGYVQAAGVNLPDQYSGLYFMNIPVRMVAVPRPGYAFSHWEGSSDSHNSTIYLDLKTDESVKAVFKTAERVEKLYLNEVGASNGHTVADEYGQFDDWLEIYNGNEFEVDLAGWFLSCSAESPEMYQVPFGIPEKTTVGAGDYLLIWCDGEPEQGALHTNFKLSKEGESLFLFQKLGDQLSIVDSMDFGNQFSDITFGRNPERDQWDYLLPTPGKRNSMADLIEVRINEYMTRNNGLYLDEFNEADDWIEIYNPTEDTIDLGGLFLTDSLPDPLKYQIPAGDIATIIPPKGFKLLWADSQEEQGALHLGFKLDSRSEQIGLYQVGAGIIDSLSYTNPYPDIPLGRIPDGSSNIQYVSATPGWGNTIDRKEGVFINEFAASNLTMVMDEYGEFNDWVEIYNANDVPVNLGGVFFTDSLGNPTKYRIPTSAPDSTTIEPNGHLVFWADGQEGQGVRHLGFKLDGRSEQIGLYQVGSGMIDSLTYLVEHTDISMGRFPDGNSQLQYLSATPGEVNHVRKLEGIQINEFMVKNATPSEMSTVSLMTG